LRNAFHKRFKNHSFPGVLFVFDEAAKLTEKKGSGQSAFVGLRRALAKLIQDCFAVLTGTASTVAQLAPPTVADPSIKVFKHGSVVFQPHYLIPTRTDPGPENSYVAVRITYNNGTTFLFRPINMAFNSRAMFYKNFLKESLGKNRSCIELSHEALMDLESSDWSRELRDSVILACEKVCSFLERKQEVHETPEAGYFAMAAIKYPVFPLDKETREEMVANHMGYIYEVPEHREIFRIIYPAEPILSESACQFCNKNSNLEKMLEELLSRHKKGLLGITSCHGDLGELLGMIVMLSLYEQAAKELYEAKRSAMDDKGAAPEKASIDGQLPSIEVKFLYSTPIPVYNFLNQIKQIPEECEDDCSAFKDGFVSFTRCIKIQGKITKDILLECFKLRCAIVPPDRQPGFDFLIPIVMLEKGEERDENELSPDDMSYIALQFKLMDNKVPESMAEDSLALTRQELTGFKHPAAFGFIQLGAGGSAFNESFVCKDDEDIGCHFSRKRQRSKVRLNNNKPVCGEGDKDSKFIYAFGVNSINEFTTIPKHIRSILSEFKASDSFIEAFDLIVSDEHKNDNDIDHLLRTKLLIATSLPSASLPPGKEEGIAELPNGRKVAATTASIMEKYGVGKLKSKRLTSLGQEAGSSRPMPDCNDMTP
jgi:hypothetical protein